MNIKKLFGISPTNEEGIINREMIELQKIRISQLEDKTISLTDKLAKYHKRNVFQLLNNALSNGYDQRNLNPNEVADGLINFSEVSRIIEDEDNDFYPKLVEYIKEWQIIMRN